MEQDELEYAERGARAYAVCCSQRELDGSKKTVILDANQIKHGSIQLPSGDNVSRKSSKRRGRPIVVDGTKYYWKVHLSCGQPTVHVLLPTGKRIRAGYWKVTEMPEYDIAPPHGGLEITPAAVAAFIRRVINHRDQQHPFAAVQ